MSQMLEVQKKDILEQMDKRFEQVDKRFEGIDKRLDSMSSQIVSLNERMERVENAIEEIKEDAAITRNGVNLLLDWAERVEDQIHIPLIKKAQ